MGSLTPCSVQARGCGRRMGCQVLPAEGAPAHARVGPCLGQRAPFLHAPLRHPGPRTAALGSPSPPRRLPLPSGPTFQISQAVDSRGVSAVTDSPCALSHGAASSSFLRKFTARSITSWPRGCHWTPGLFPCLGHCGRCHSEHGVQTSLRHPNSISFPRRGISGSRLTAGNRIHSNESVTRRGRVSFHFPRPE